MVAEILIRIKGVPVAVGHKRHDHPISEQLDPAILKGISEAMDQLCSILQFSPTATGARSVIEKQLVFIAEHGERSPERMRDAILANVARKGRLP